MRDASVIIASGPKGYKIPTSVSDLRQFVAHAQSIVPRMLFRLKTARDELRLASSGDLDILADKELDHLRKLVECE